MKEVFKFCSSGVKEIVAEDFVEVLGLVVELEVPVDLPFDDLAFFSRSALALAISSFTAR